MIFLVGNFFFLMVRGNDESIGSTGSVDRCVNIGQEMQIIKFTTPAIRERFFLCFLLLLICSFHKKFR